MPIQTPAQTARADINKYSPKLKNAQRYQDVRKRAKEIRDTKIVAENLIELSRTDMPAAIARWKEIQVEAQTQAEQDIPRVALSADDQKRYVRARFLRGTARNWQHTNDVKFFDVLEASVENVKQRIAKDNTTVSFMRLSIPTIAEFTGEEDKKEFTDQDTIVTNYDDGSVGTVLLSEKYRSLVSAFNIFIDKFDDVIEGYEEEIELYDADPIGDIKAAIEALGLIRIYEDISDGCLWYKNPNTGKLHYYNLNHRISGGISVLEKFDQNNLQVQNWQDNWHVDLSLIAVRTSNYGYRLLEDIAKTYFGLWDDLRPWLSKSIDAGNIPSDDFPYELLKEKTRE